MSQTIEKKLAKENQITISLAAIEQNMATLFSCLDEKVLVMAIIKGNAYGHGSWQVAKKVLQAGATWLGVARVKEGIFLREKGITAPILVLGPAFGEEALQGVCYDLTLTLTHQEQLHWINEGCQAYQKSANVHMKIDTGMNRIGVKNSAEAKKLQEKIKEYPQIILTGAFTHFAQGYEEKVRKKQLNQFNLVVKEALPKGLLLHTAATSAALLDADTHHNMVRMGIGIYGYPPIETNLHFVPALSWETRVTYIKEVQAGEEIGYGGTYQAKKPMNVATLSVGYGDGYLRRLSNVGEVLVHGTRAKIVGRICMDQMMIDISHIPDVEIGDQVILIGKQGEEEITAQNLADLADTISYEVLLAPTSRVTKVWIEG
ncbi:MAG: alanine racemase [Clostridiales bacterium]|nr:alanine racemase [Clostridiales bacterium]